LCAGCFAGSGASAESGFSGIATLTSQYVYRGQALSDGNPAIQLGLDYELDSGVFAGIWGSTIDLRSVFGSRDTELNYYIGYHYAPQRPVSVAATLLHYAYPGQTGPHNYDHNEYLVTAMFRERYSIEFGYTNDLYGLGRVGRHWELRADQPVANAWVISAGLGQNDMTDIDVDRYLYWDIGASARFSRLTVDLRWFDNENPDTLPDYVSADSQYVVSLSVAF
jgi:uncharacterized protein (TIGR02001 family)